MKQGLPTFFALSAIGFASVSAQEIITTVPQGNVVEYYADFQNFDNYFGFMGDYHSQWNITFTDDDEVYIPNLLLRRTFPLCYVKGQYDRDAATITVAAGQQVFYFPNVEIPVGLYMLDADGLAGDKDTKQPYDDPLVFKVADDGTLTLVTTNERPMFGVCNMNDPEEVYANAKELSFTPVSNTTDKIQYYDYSYTHADESEPTHTTVSLYRQDNDIYIKGFDPKYPEAWIKATYDGQQYLAASFQVVYYFANEDPIVFLSEQKVDAGRQVMTGLPIEYDQATDSYTACSDGFLMANATLDESSNVTYYQEYKDLKLTKSDVKAAKPAAPVFVNYDYRSSTNETEFTFTADPSDEQGNTLPKDALAFRLYVDNALYTFTPALYNINSEMSSVPYNFNSYSFFCNSDTKRYVYFKDLPEETKTLGVEVVYTLGDKEYVSKRLTYDIASGKADLSGIHDIASDREIIVVQTYDLCGRPIADDNARGVSIKVIRYSDGSTRTVKQAVVK